MQGVFLKYLGLSCLSSLLPFAFFAAQRNRCPYAAAYEFHHTFNTPFSRLDTGAHQYLTAVA